MLKGLKYCCCCCAVCGKAVPWLAGSNVEVERLCIRHMSVSERWADYISHAPQWSSLTWRHSFPDVQSRHLRQLQAAAAQKCYLCWAPTPAQGERYGSSCRCCAQQMGPAVAQGATHPCHETATAHAQSPCALQRRLQWYYTMFSMCPTLECGKSKCTARWQKKT